MKKVSALTESVLKKATVKPVCHKHVDNWFLKICLLK
jgi:hypothetical protein